MNADSQTHGAPLQPIRPRRLRTSAALREAVCETRVHPAQLIQPHFVLDQDSGEELIPSMPGIVRHGRTELLRQVEADWKLGLRSVLLFGLPKQGGKDSTGSASSDPLGPVPQAVRELKRAFGPDLVVMTDVCLCAYTDHGHCGVLAGGKIDNDASLGWIADAALAHAQAGADFVAPSDMMDGRIGAIRTRLDGEGLPDVGILAYSVKYASAYYGPFREAADSAPAHGDRRSYQMDPRNGREALREVALDEQEGADMIMVKPALAYLDVISRVRGATQLPVVAYNVSGEYSAVKAAAMAGWLDEGQVVRENLHAMVRAGSDLVITYHARAALQQGWL
ncbi:MAG TPA: porphobilinogen synthase [Planctomycetota bacterium]|nr:porphobilinogen synthase [Planctomycetota bacterium]